jgi:2',3'-cyclic-nucleotide 2'-phosphodiesterase (5'-nucleotidase family)
MNRMGFAAMTLGGHEFDWGEEWVRKNGLLAEFPLLGINVYDRNTDQQVDYCQSSLMVETEGLQIGIIGAIGDCYDSISSENTKDIYFKTGAELTALVKAESQRLRDQGADFIVYTLHDGYHKTTSDTSAMTVGAQELESYYDTSLSDGYVDLVFEADSHYWYVLVDQHGVYHLQGGANNDGLAHARVIFDKATGDFDILVAELIPDTAYKFMEDDPVVEELLEKYAQQIAPATRILGENPTYKNSAALCQLVANLYCAKGVEKWGAEYDIVLGGGYLSCRSPGYLSPGEVSYSQLQSLFPFDNPITLCSIRGSDLLSKFLETDHYAYYIKTTSYGESIRNSIDPDGTYYVVTDSYSANYAYNRMTVIDTYGDNIFARDLVADYITEGGFD